MSKSLGNSLLVDAVLHRTTPVVLRYALGTVHYRSTVEFSDASLEESRAAWERVEGFVRRALVAEGMT
jgi:cysteinyl-tRNA synthetase